MKKRCITALLLTPLVFSLNCVAPMHTLTVKGDGGFSDPKTSLYFSPYLCGLNKAKMDIYPQQELGVSYFYQDHEFIKVSFYVFDAGVKSISEGCTAAVVTAHFDQALKDLYIMQNYGKYNDVTYFPRFRVEPFFGFLSFSI